MPWWSAPLLWLLLLLAGVRWRGVPALPQGSPGASQSSALNTSAMFLVQCSFAEATRKDKTLLAINMFYNNDKDVIAKVTLHGTIKCEEALFNRRVNTTLQTLLDHYDALANLTCEYVFDGDDCNRSSASVTMVNVTSFNVCRSSRCGGPGRPFSCGPGRVSLDCPKGPPEGQGWVVQRLVNGNWSSLSKATTTCNMRWSVQDAVLVEDEDRDRLAGRIVDVAHVSEKRFAYVHPNGTCQICVVDAALADHSSLIGLPANGSVVVVLSVTVGVLLVIIVVLLVIILCLYLRRGGPWRCVFQRRRPVPNLLGAAVIDAVLGEDRRNDREPQVGRDKNESKDLLGPHSDSCVCINGTRDDCSNSDG